MPLDFPPSPAVNEIYTFGGRYWIWNGTAWDSYNPSASNVVTQLNGLTGGVTLESGTGITLSSSGNTITISSTGTSGISGPYVISISGLTGIVGITRSNGININVSGQTLTFSNTGVLSFNGNTGAIQGVNLLGAGSGITISPTGGTGNVTVINAGVTSINGSVGAISNVAFTNQGNTFSVQQIMNAGLSAAGGVSFANQTFHGQTASFNANIALANNELISNTVNGRIDFIPIPAGTTNFGTYIDGTTSGIGVRIGTIRTSDNALNAGPIQFDPLILFVNGISAAGATLSVNTTIPSGSTLTVNGNFIANGNVNLGDANTDSITVAGLLSANTGISSAGGTFSLLTRFTEGISASGGTFNSDIRVGTILLGNGFAGVTSNVAIGFNTLRAVSTGANNVAIGESALAVNTMGDVNVAIGQDALSSNIIGRYNVALGQATLRSNTGGEYSVAIGGGALLNQIGLGVRDNVAIGAGSGQTITTGGSNVSVGRSSLGRNAIGGENTAIGYNALVGAAGSQPYYTTAIGSNTLFSNNGYIEATVAVGTRALFSVTNGATNNTAVGAYSLHNITTQSNNTALGMEAGRYVGITTSPLSNTARSIYVGHRSRGGANGAANEIVIGTDAVGLGTNTAVIGNTSQTSATIYGLLTAPNGISASGATFLSDINVNGMRVGLGSGNVSSNVAFGAAALNSGTTGERNVAIGANSLQFLTTGSDNVLIGNLAASQATLTGAGNVGIGTSALYRLGANSSTNTAIGYQSGFGSTSNFRQANTSIGYNSMISLDTGSYNSSVGTNSLYFLRTGAQNTAVGTEALFSLITTSNNVGIGIQAGAYLANGVSGFSAGSNCTFIGALSRASSATTSREIVIGANAVGLGSNTAVIGMTTQASATIYGLLTAPNGISTSGITILGNISAYNLAGGNPGVTTSVGTYTFPDGITTYQVKTQYYQSTFAVDRDSTGFTVRANRTYFSLFYTPVPRTIQSIRMQTHTTGSTGSAFFGIYSTNPTTGFPQDLLWSSTSTTVAGNFSQTTVSSVNYTVNPGWFYLGACCSLTPTLYAYNKVRLMPVFGSAASSDGYMNLHPVADTSGFTLPTSLPSAGVTFAFVDFIVGNYSGIRLEYGI
jgi:hypothetical protein